MRFPRLSASLLALTLSLSTSAQGLGNPPENALVLPVTGLIPFMPEGASRYRVKSYFRRLNDGYTLSDAIAWSRFDDASQSEITRYYAVSTLEPYRAQCNFDEKKRLGRLTLGALPVELFEAEEQEGVVVLCHAGDYTKAGLLVAHAVAGLSQLNPAVLREYLLGDANLQALFKGYADNQVAVWQPPLLKTDIEHASSEPWFDSMGVEPLFVDRPSDGFEWMGRKAEGKILTLYSPLPSLAPVEVKLAIQEGRACSDLTEVGYPDPDVLDGWLSLERITAHGVEHFFCHEHQGDTYWAKVQVQGALKTPTLFEPLLTEFAAAGVRGWPRLDEWPDFIVQEMPYARRVSGLHFEFFEFGLMGNLSVHRNTGLDADIYPDLRSQGPGLRASYYDVSNGFMWGLTGAGAMDLESRSGVSSAARWGAYFARASAELGYLIGKTWFTGFSAGLSVMSGPLTLNQSVPLSIYVGHAPWKEGDWGMMVKVTPIQLFASNQREFLSPLSIDVMFSTDGQGFGFEFQYLGDPSGIETGMGLGGWSFGASYGISSFTR